MYQEVNESMDEKRDNFFRETSDDYNFTYNSARNRVIDGMGNEGVYVSNFDLDNSADLLTVGGNYPVLYDNLGNKLSIDRRFEDVDGYVRSAHFFDANNNGFDDLILIRRGNSPVFYQNQNGNYIRKENVIENNLGNPMGAVSGDFSGNDCNDLFIYQNGDHNNRRAMIFDEIKEIREKPEQRISAKTGRRNLLFTNSCNNSEIEFEAKKLEGKEWSLAASAADFNDDGRLDIHIANDFYRDVILVNTENGFNKTYMSYETRRHGMASEIADFSGNGKPDIFVTNINFGEKSLENKSCLISLAKNKCSIEKKENYYPLVHNFEGNNLLVNQGGLEFKDLAEEKGVSKGGWGWSSNVADFTNNGKVDITHSNSYSYLYQDSKNINTINFWEGREDGFKKKTDIGFTPGNRRGIARIDLNQDGCMDIVTANRDPSFNYEAKKFEIYTNTGCSEGSIQIRLKANNSEIKGSKVTLMTNKGRQVRFPNSRSNFLSQSSRVLHFGLAKGETAEKIRIEFLNKTERTYDIEGKSESDILEISRY